VSPDARTRFLDRHGGRLAYDDTGGSGRAVLAVPGIGDRRQTYRHVVPVLAGHGVRVVTVDLRGMGESSTGWPDHSDVAIADDLVALVQHLDLHDVVLVGNSLGAAAAVLASVAAPDRVRGLVLIGPFARALPMPWWQRAGFRALLAPPWGRRAWVHYFGTKMFPGPRPDDLEAYTATLGRVLAEPGRMPALRALAANTHAESGAQLGSVSVPTLVIMGSADPDFPDPAAEAAAIAEATRGEVRMVDGSGHYPQADSPAVVADAILSIVHRAAG
jgi:pimeloyl-ACP methyl ester carboxylesterase